jgi:carbamoyl-phosphate synthase small subunit
MPQATYDARLCLEDGSVYPGFSVGATGSALGELVFNTSVTGYQEIVTDPSYKGQVVMMTHPEIGNYGTHPDDNESDGIHAAGFIIRRMSPEASNWRSQQDLPSFMRERGLIGIAGVDTRAITRKVRDGGVFKSMITTEALTLDAIKQQLQQWPGLSQQPNLVPSVSTAEAYTVQGKPQVISPIKHLAIMDYGLKRSILTQFQLLAQHITVLPQHTSFAELLALSPDAVVLSNGPGDPAILAGPIAFAKDLIASGLPTLGICLGYQLLGLACGIKAEKMPFGHHGGNHPVMDLETGSIMITSQNHSYALCRDSLADSGMKETHVNLNDKTLEGFRHPIQPVWALQFHPEAAPGPQDARGLLARFAQKVVARG